MSGSYPSNLIRMICGTFLAAGSALAGPVEHGEDLVIGRTSSGQLAVEVPVPGPHELPPVGGLLQGWAHDDPGLLSLDANEPGEDRFVLESGAIISLELVSIAPALKVWSPGFLSVLTTPGQSFVLGGSEFDAHPTFHIDSTDPALDPNEDLYFATFRVVDTGSTGYGPSGSFSLSFTPVPEPSTILLAGLGAWVINLSRSRPHRVRKVNP